MASFRDFIENHISTYPCNKLELERKGGSKGGWRSSRGSLVRRGGINSPNFSSRFSPRFVIFFPFPSIDRSIDRSIGAHGLNELVVEGEGTVVEKVFMRGGARRTKATRSGRINKTNTMYDAILHTSRLSVPEATVSTYDRQLLSRECWTPFVPRRCLYISLGPVCLVSSRLVSSRLLAPFHSLSLSLLSSSVVSPLPSFPWILLDLSSLLRIGFRTNLVKSWLTVTIPTFLKRPPRIAY